MNGIQIISWLLRIASRTASQTIKPWWTSTAIRCYRSHFCTAAG